MLFNSIEYLIFFLIVSILYYILPYRFRWIMLLSASYYFYACWSPKYALLMLLSTLITYLSGLLMEKETEVKRKKLWLFMSFFLNLSILFFFKYFNFTVNTIERLSAYLKFSISIPNFEILLPVGISFYTFQALSYTMDVYRKDIKAQRNFGKYALFVSFFPGLVAGPIEKSTNLLYQFDENIDFDYNRTKDGLLMMLWGLIKKIVIADRLAILVNTVYQEPQIYYGMPLLVASIFFSFQIYCDFSGYSDMAIGCAKIFGYDLMENFKRPYFSQSIAEFWRRWHISLNTWFKDYLYVPLGGSKVGKLRRYLNIMIIFTISGLWHGAAWNYVVWGFGHGMLQILGYELKSVRDFFVKILKVDRQTFSHKLFKILITFFLANIMWVFFRANSLKDSIYILRKMFRTNFWTFFDGTMYRLGLDEYDFKLSIKLMCFLLIADFISEKINFKEFLQKQGLLFRWLIYFIGIFSVVIFGIYGNNEIVSNFIYFQF